MPSASSLSRLLGVVAFALASTHAGRAVADEPTASEAERLFAEGRDLLAAGDAREACARFDASHRIAPDAVGPIYNLAVCNESLGKLATATRYFREVVDRSLGVRSDRVDAAIQKLRSLEPRLSGVRVVVADEARAGLQIRVDGETLAADRWGATVPLDGGAHVVVADSTSGGATQHPVTLANEGEVVVVSLGLAKPAPRSRTAGFVVGGAGLAFTLAGLGLGTSLAVRCGGFFQDTCAAADGLPDRERESKLDSLRTQGWISTGAVAVGAVAMAVGGFLLWPRSEPSRLDFRSTGRADRNSRARIF